MAVRPTDLDWESWLEGAAARYDAANLSSTHDVSDGDVAAGPTSVDKPRKRLCVKTPSDAAGPSMLEGTDLGGSTRRRRLPKKSRSDRRIRRGALLMVAVLCGHVVRLLRNAW